MNNRRPNAAPRCEQPPAAGLCAFGRGAADRAPFAPLPPFRPRAGVPVPALSVAPGPCRSLAVAAGRTLGGSPCHTARVEIQRKEQTYGLGCFLRLRLPWWLGLRYTSQHSQCSRTKTRRGFPAPTLVCSPTGLR